MNIYIESKDGAFHDITDAGWERAQYYTGGAVYGYFSDCSRRTEGRDFEVGSRVYFQSVGWADIEYKGAALCGECIFATGQRCVAPDDLVCSGRLFRSIEPCEAEEFVVESTVPTAAEAEKYYAMKNDNGKSRMDLLPFDALKGVADVLTFGAKKYTPNGWKDVPDAIPRYEAALLRHFTAIKTGEHNDPETGLPHIYHVACNALFLASLTGPESK